MTVVEAASALDGSVGWLVGNGGGMSRIGGYLPEPVAREFFSDPRGFITSATGAVGSAAEGGRRLSRHRPLAVRQRRSSRVALHGPRERRKVPTARTSRRSAAISSAAMSSSTTPGGCRGCAARAAATSRSAISSSPSSTPTSLWRLRPTQDGIVYRLPVVSVFAWTVSVVPLGIARGAMNAFAELASRKARQGASALLRDREIVQSNYGRADALHRAARAFLIDAMSELMAASAEGGPRLINARAVFRAACTHAAESAVRIADMLAAETGAVAIFETSPIERFVRDIHAAVKHIAMSPNNYVVSGRVGLGLDPGTPRF